MTKNRMIFGSTIRFLTQGRRVRRRCSWMFDSGDSIELSRGSRVRLQGRKKNAAGTLASRDSYFYPVRLNSGEPSYMESGNSDLAFKVR